MTNGESHKYDGEEIYRQFFPLVLMKIRASLGWDFNDAQDLAHEVIRITLDSVNNGKFKGNASLGTYIYSITRNQVSSTARRPTMRREVPLDDHAPVVDPPDPVEDLIRDETRQILSEEIAKLKPRHQRVIFLKFYEGKRAGEISEMLHLTPRKVSELLHYSLKRLATSLRARVHDSPGIRH